MSTTRASIYRGGELHPDDECSVWIDVLNPFDSDFDVLQQRFQLHRVAVRDARCGMQAPKLDIYDDQIFVVLKIARLRNDEIVYAEIDAFVSSLHIVTVHHDHAGAFADAEPQIRGGLPATRSGPDFILHALMARVVGDYVPVVQMVEDEVLAMEQRLLDAFLSRDDVTRLFRLRREAIHLRHVITRMSDVCAKLAHLEVPCVAIEARPYFRDLHGQLERLDGMVNGLVDVIGAVFEAGSLLEQQRQGSGMRQLAAWAAILGAPTAIAAVYDMNFRDMPGVNSPYGFFVVLAVMFSICVVLYLRFKRARWL
jgi:magnesium transporter